MVGACRDERSVSLVEAHPLPLDLERSRALEDEIQLVVRVWLLTVGLGCDENVDADLEPGGLVDDLVATGVPQPSQRGFDVKRVGLDVPDHQVSLLRRTS